MTPLGVGQSERKGIRDGGDFTDTVGGGNVFQCLVVHPEGELHRAGPAYNPEICRIEIAVLRLGVLRPLDFVRFQYLAFKRDADLLRHDLGLPGGGGICRECLGVVQIFHVPRVVPGDDHAEGHHQACPCQKDDDECF